MSYRFVAPGAEGPSTMGCPGIEDRLAPPETRLEYIDGIEYFSAPADVPHATRHAQVTKVIGLSAAPNYDTAVDLLTRTDDASDFAPDVSVFSKELEVDGSRKLEELSFEITSEQRLCVPTKKARGLVARGVRRVFCVLVKQGRVMEWSRALDTWQPLHRDDVITDPALICPVPVAALIDAAAADIASARALIAQHHPVLEAAIADSEKRGEARGKAEGEADGTLEEARRAVRLVLSVRQLSLTPDQERRIATSETRDELESWLQKAVLAQTLADVFDR